VSTETLLQRYQQLVWERPTAAMPVWESILVYTARMLQVLVRDLASGDLNLRAMSLVYTTLLSMVPLLALSFSILKGFGVQNQLRPMLLNALSTLGEKGVEITDQIIGFVNNMNVGVLGVIGLVFLIYTVVALMNKIERNFNYIWRVAKSRSLARRFSDYLSVVLVGPVLVFSAMGLTATAQNTEVVVYLMGIEPFGTLIAWFFKALPFMLVVVAFTFVYVFIPNTKVQIGPALVGGVAAGLMWNIVGQVFASFVVTSGNYAAIYSAFATLIFFLIWLYLGWLILMLGSSISFYIQNPGYITSTAQRVPSLSNRMKEHLALMLMSEVGRHFYHKLPACDEETLSEAMHTDSQKLDPVIQMLLKLGYLERTTDDERYVPGVPLDETLVADLLQDVRCSGEEEYFAKQLFSDDWPVEGVMVQVVDAGRQALQDMTLKELVVQSEKDKA
jgi:membrane protein